MGLTELFILAVGLSMDAFAVAVCKGLAMPKVTWKKITAVGLWFGGFQALMPAAGYFLGIRFKDGITAIDHWIAFMLLSIIGINMIREAFSGDEESSNDLLDCKTMFPLAVATSIDALAVGITFAFFKCTYYSCRFIYRRNNVYHRCRRCKNRKHIRDKIQSESRACRRYHPDSSRR